MTFHDNPKSRQTLFLHNRGSVETDHKPLIFCLALMVGGKARLAPLSIMGLQKWILDVSWGKKLNSFLLTHEGFPWDWYMNCMIYFPTWMADFHGFFFMQARKYTVRSMGIRHGSWLKLYVNIDNDLKIHQPPHEIPCVPRCFPISLP